METLNLSANAGSDRHVIIDLEEYFREGRNHPEVDPGVIIIYRFKIDDQPYETNERRKSGRELLELAGKAPKHFDLEQLLRVDGRVEPVFVDHDQVIDFGSLGIERFVTKHKPYTFYIDQRDFHTRHASLTVREILEDFAKVSPENNTLAKKIPGGFHEYKDLNERLPLEDCPHFTIFCNEPTRVS